VAAVQGAVGQTVFLNHRGAGTGGFDFADTADGTVGTGLMSLTSGGLDLRVGKVQLPTHTTTAGGVAFHTDALLHRHGAEGLTFRGSALTNGKLLFGPSSIEIGAERTSAAPAYIDITTETGSPDFNTRLIRDVGPNANATLFNTGAGAIVLAPNNGAANSALTVGSAITGFFGVAAVAKPTVSGSRGGNAALASLITGLASLGLLTDSTSA